MCLRDECTLRCVAILQPKRQPTGDVTEQSKRVFSGVGCATSLSLDVVVVVVMGWRHSLKSNCAIVSRLS